MACPVAPIWAARADSDLRTVVFVAQALGRCGAKIVSVSCTHVRWLNILSCLHLGRSCGRWRRRAGACGRLCSSPLSFSSMQVVQVRDVRGEASVEEGLSGAQRNGGRDGGETEEGRGRYKE